MIDLATKLVNDWEGKSTNQEPERTPEFIAKLDSLRENLAEDEFLDKVFGNHSNITRKEWEDGVVRNVKWIFDSNQLRQHIYSRVEKL